MAIYMTIATQLREEVRQQYESGDLLPSEKKLAERFGVNRHTIRRAVDELVQDGLIKRFQGLGNQVTQPAIDYALDNQSCFTYNLSKKGVSLETKVHSCTEGWLPQELALRLQLGDNTPIVLLKTCRSLNEKPVTLIRHHLFNVEKAVMCQYQTGSLHSFLQDHYQYHAKRGTTRLKARMPTFEECQQLEIGRGVPVMEIHSKYYLVKPGTDEPISSDKPLMEYSISVSRSDIFEYSVEP